jgi:hypothetical protein
MALLGEMAPHDPAVIQLLYPPAIVVSLSLTRAARVDTAMAVRMIKKSSYVAVSSSDDWALWPAILAPDLDPSLVVPFDLLSPPAPLLAPPRDPHLDLPRFAQRPRPLLFCQPPDIGGR